MALRNLGERKLRTFLTSLSIVLGVMMVAGTYVLTDTINQSFDEIFTESNQGTDAVVSAKEIVETDDGTEPPISASLLPRTTAIENVELPLIYAGIARKERAERAHHALERVGLGERALHRPSLLSGGQQQRVAIARAIVNRPVLMLADEPTGNLDSKTSQSVMALFQELWRGGLTIVYVTHEPDIAAYASRVIVMRDGRILSDAPQHERAA